MLLHETHIHYQRLLVLCHTTPVQQMTSATCYTVFGCQGVGDSRRKQNCLLLTSPTRCECVSALWSNDHHWHMLDLHPPTHCCLQRFPHTRSHQGNKAFLTNVKFSNILVRFLSCVGFCLIIITFCLVFAIEVTKFLRLMNKGLCNFPGMFAWKLGNWDESLYSQF